MENIEQQLQELFDKGEWSGQDYDLFLALTEQHSPADWQFFFYERYNQHLQKVVPANRERAQQLLQQVQERLGISAPVLPLRKKRYWPRMVAAAAILLGLIIGGYFLLIPKPVKPGGLVKTTEPTDVKAPAVNRAMITLADGKTVYLDSAGNGTLAQQGNTQVVKLSDGKIAYQGQQPTAHSQQLSYNTLFNPRGSKVIDMTLSDGSHVWLNAGSSVTYPVAFTRSERTVSITGEAYFEVTHNTAKPFVVTKGDMQVQVLGTHFNVNAYDDEEDIKVTLLQGSVKVKSERPKAGTGINEVIIKPGEQASISEIRDPIRVIRAIHVIRDIDLEQVMSWKNGLFQFNKADTKTVMRQLERWYNIEVTYPNGVPDHAFMGQIDRNLSLVNALNILSKSGLKFTLEGNVLTIL